MCEDKESWQLGDRSSSETDGPFQALIFSYAAACSCVDFRIDEKKQVAPA